MGFPGGLMVKNPPANAGEVGSIPGLQRSPGEETATYFRILAWDRGGLQSIVSQKSRSGLSD